MSRGAVGAVGANGTVRTDMAVRGKWQGMWCERGDNDDEEVRNRKVRGGVRPSAASGRMVRVERPAAAPSGPVRPSLTAFTGAGPPPLSPRAAARMPVWLVWPALASASPFMLLQRRSNRGLSAPPPCRCRRSAAGYWAKEHRREAGKQACGVCSGPGPQDVWVEGKVGSERVGENRRISCARPSDPAGSVWMGFHRSVRKWRAVGRCHLKAEACL